jgi:hypothetical protein
MKKIQISDIKSTKDNKFVESQLSKKELEKTIGGRCPTPIVDMNNGY